MSAATSRGLGAIFKQAWNEIPEVVGSTFMGVIGIGLGLAGLYVYNQKDGDNRRYKLEYTVIRDDDPLAKFVKKREEE